MKKILILLFSMLISFNSYGEWTFHSETIDGTNFYIDYETIRENGGYVYYWEMADYVKDHEDGNLSSAVYTQGDCAIFRVNHLSLTGYNQSMGTGEGATYNFEDDWIYPVPGSTVENTLNLVCDYID